MKTPLERVQDVLTYLYKERWYVRLKLHSKQDDLLLLLPAEDHLEEHIRKRMGDIVTNLNLIEERIEVYEKELAELLKTR